MLRPGGLARSVRVAFALLAATGAARAAASAPDEETKALPCRPTIACTADLVKPGLFELEVGMLYRRPGATKQWTLPFLAKLTLAKFIQLQVGSNGYTSEHGTSADDSAPVQYFDDVYAGAKIHLADQSRLVPSLSLSAAFAAPVERAEPGYTPAEDALFTAYVTKDFGPLHADLNLGLNDFGLDGTAVVQEWAALALSVSLTTLVGAMVEGYYFTDAAPLAARDGGVLFALSLSPRPWLIFDFGGDVGYFPETRAYSSFVGMTIVPVKLWL